MWKIKFLCNRIAFSFKRNYEFRKYTKNIPFMFKILFLEIVIMLKFISKKFDRFHQKMFSIIKWDVIFTTPFWKFLASNPNWYFVMEENYEPMVKKIIIDNVSKFYNNQENIFLNIWSHIWRRSIDLAKNHNYKCFAFEPSPLTYRNLKINILLSNVEDKVITFNYWLWDKEDYLDFEYIPLHDWSSRVFQKWFKQYRHSKMIKVPIKKMDDLNLWIKNNNIRLIMIDVEWFEYNVLKGMSDMLDALYDVDIIVEILPENKDKDNVIEYMKNKWYNVKQIDDIDYLFRK